MKTILLAATTAIALFASPAAASVFDGTWKGDIAASNISKQPIVYSLAGGKYSCSSCTPPVNVPADGAPHATTGNPYYDSMTVTVVDASTVKRATTLAGKPAWESTVTIAPGGQTMSNRYNDMTATNGVPVTGTSNYKRVAAATPGAHAFSGSWEETNDAEVAEAGLVFTLAMAGDTLRFSTPTGISYAAKLGAISPVSGDPGWTAVMVKAEGPNTLMETDYRDGKPISTYRMTIAADGKTMTSESHNLLNGRKSTLIARKQ